MSNSWQSKHTHNKTKNKRQRTKKTKSKNLSLHHQHKLTDLPQDTLIQIFQFASDSPKTILRLSHVCKEFDTLSSENPFVWQYCPCPSVNDRKISLKSGYVTRSKYKPTQLYTSNRYTSNGDGTSHNLLLKYFSSGPLFHTNSKYKHMHDLFEKQLHDHSTYLKNEMELKKQDKLVGVRKEDDKTEREKSEELYQLNTIKYSYRRPLLVSKHQYIDHMKFLYKNEASAIRDERIRNWFEVHSEKLTDSLSHSLAIVFYIFFWFIMLGTGQFKFTSYLDFSQFYPIFYPLQLLFVVLATYLTIFTFRNWFKLKSDSELILYVVFWIALIYARMLVLFSIDNMYNMIHTGLPQNHSIFSSWYSIALPLLILTLFKTVAFYNEEFKHNSFINRIYTEDTLLSVTLSTSIVFTLLALPPYMQGWRYARLSILTFPLIATEIYWTFCMIKSYVRSITTRDNGDHRGLLVPVIMLLDLAIVQICYCWFGFIIWLLWIPLVIAMTFPVLRVVRIYIY
jgi:hypothetical protein